MTVPFSSGRPSTKKESPWQARENPKTTTAIRSGRLIHGAVITRPGARGALQYPPTDGGGQGQGARSGAPETISALTAPSRHARISRESRVCPPHDVTR